VTGAAQQKIKLISRRAALIQRKAGCVAKPDTAVSARTSRADTEPEP
jgi:hypothetical protein